MMKRKRTPKTKNITVKSKKEKKEQMLDMIIFDRVVKTLSCRF